MSRLCSILVKILLSAAALAGFAALATVAPFGGVRGTPPTPSRTAAQAPPALEHSGVEADCGEPKEQSLAASGLAGFTLTPAAVAPRTSPVPLAPGSIEIARFRSPGLTLFLDQPREPGLALELAAVAFNEAGWRSPSTDQAAGAIYVRGSEVAVVTLEDAVDPLLLIAYHGDSSLLEDAP